MSVQQKQYLIIGVNLPFDYFNHLNNDDDFDTYSFLEDYMISNYDQTYDKELSCLFDGMNGKYIIIGKIIAHAYEHSYDYAIDFLNLSETLEQHKNTFLEVQLNIKEHFNIEPKLSMLLITHYS